MVRMEDVTLTERVTDGQVVAKYTKGCGWMNLTLFNTSPNSEEQDTSVRMSKDSVAKVIEALQTALKEM